MLGDPRPARVAFGFSATVRLRQLDRYFTLAEMHLDIYIMRLMNNILC